MFANGKAPGEFAEATGLVQLNKDLWHNRGFIQQALEEMKTMGKMIGVCGLVCTECPAFLATQEDDDDARKKVGELWSKQFNMIIPSEHINCDGCLSENGRLFCHCKVCEIRKCGQEKGLPNCANCREYACEKLNKVFEMAPNAKTTLEEIRKGS